MSNSTDRLKAKSINEQKAERKFLFQVISHVDGKRSEPFLASWDHLHKTLNENKDHPDYPGDDYLLLVSVLDGEDTIIPATPIIRISTFAALAASPEA